MIVSPKLKYPEVAGILMGGICEVTTNTSAAKIAARASIRVVPGRYLSLLVILSPSASLYLEGVSYLCLFSSRQNSLAFRRYPAVIDRIGARELANRFCLGENSKWEILADIPR